MSFKKIADTSFKLFSFFPEFVGPVGKWPGQKAQINFKIYIINWEANNYNTYTVKYLKMTIRQKKFG